MINGERLLLSIFIVKKFLLTLLFKKYKLILQRIFAVIIKQALLADLLWV